MEEKITIDIGAYYRLLEAEAQLDVLVARGVDNWEGYTNVPSIADFETFMGRRRRGADGMLIIDSDGNYRCTECGEALELSLSGQTHCEYCGAPFEGPPPIELSTVELTAIFSLLLDANAEGYFPNSWWDMHREELSALRERLGVALLKREDVEPLWRTFVEAVNGRA
jgi:hypothetical protein